MLPVSANAIKFSDLQSEFTGGSNPISLSEYYRTPGGTYVNKAGYYGYPGGTKTLIPTSGALKMGNFHSAAKVYEPVSLTAIYNSVSEMGVVAVVSLSYTWYSTGEVQSLQYTSGGGYVAIHNGFWTKSASATVGTNHYIRFTRTSHSEGGTGTSTASTGWLQLNSSQTVTLYASVYLVGANYYSSFANALYTVEISEDSGTNILSSTTSLGGDVTADSGI